MNTKKTIILVALAIVLGSAAFLVSYQKSTPEFPVYMVRMETTFKGENATNAGSFSTVSSRWADGKMSYMTETTGRDGKKWTTREIDDPVTLRHVMVSDTMQRYTAFETHSTPDQARLAQLDPGEDCLKNYVGHRRYPEAVGRGEILGYKTVKVELPSPVGIDTVSLAPNLGCATLEVDNATSTQRAVWITRTPNPNMFLINRDYVASSTRQMAEAKLEHLGIVGAAATKSIEKQAGRIDDKPSKALPEVFFLKPCPACEAQAKSSDG